MNKLKLAWSVYETIGISIINPRIDPFYPIKIDIQDFCYAHDSTKGMHDFIGSMLIKHPQYAHRIKDVVLCICPQYKDMIDKIIVLM